MHIYVGEELILHNSWGALYYSEIEQLEPLHSENCLKTSTCDTPPDVGW